ncbi:MAG: hypothetical protein GY778_20855, partial [bacterium]|nr:hypothetical protein [bacterium]
MRILALLLLLPVFSSAEDIGVRVLLGLTDTESTRWDGTASTTGATIATIDPWRFESDDAIDGNSWRLVTRNIQLFGSSAKKPVVANGVILRLTNAREDAEVRVQTAQGDFAFRLSEIPYGVVAKKLDGRAMVDRIPPVEQLTTNRAEQDYPAIARAPNGDVWLVWMEFTHSAENDRFLMAFSEPPDDFDMWKALPGGDRIWLRRYSAGSWSEPMAITRGGEDLYRPAVAVDGQNRVWVFWSTQQDGNFDIWKRVVANGRPGPAERISTAAGSDIDPVAATDSSGRVWLAWQGWRNGRAAIFVARQDGDSFTEPAVIAASSGNEWNPAIAADRSGRVAVAWDSYRAGNYDVFLRTAVNVEWGGEVAVATTARYEAYPSLAYEPGGRLWIAYEEGHERWGKDYGADESTGVALYKGRAVRLRGIEPNGDFVEPKVDVGTVLPGRSSNKADSDARQADMDDWFRPDANAWKVRDMHATTQLPAAPKNSHPRLQVDTAGRLWLTVRSNHPNWWFKYGTVWSEHVVSYDGAEWSGPVFLSHSDNLLDNRPALVSTDDGLLVVGSSDWRR